MKKSNELLKSLWFVAIILILGSFASCSDDPADPPIANFEFAISETNPQEVSFTSLSQNATTYAWNFGDDSGTSTEENPTYIYPKGGNYTVTLTATNESGSDNSANEISIEAVNQIQNGDFSDNSVWTIISHNGSSNGLLTISNGVAVWDEAMDVPSGDWGNEAHMGMNQTVTVTEGNYQFDLDIITNGLDEVWFELWVGTTAPVAGEDYNGDDGATRVLSFNTWDCGDTNKTYSGSMAAASCHDLDGSINLDAGTYYVVIRSGGFTFGAGGIIVDNVTMY